jgi:hypothetical protein
MSAQQGGNGSLPISPSGILEQSLAAAQEQSDIFRRAPRPFLLEAELTVQLAVPTPGRLTIHWQSKNHWRRELSYGPYKETIVRVGEWEYAQRNVTFAPVRTTQIDQLLQFGRDNGQFAPNRARTRKRDGTVLACIELVNHEAAITSELCTDPVTHDITSITPWIYGVDGGNAEFSGYDGIEGMRFPKHLELRFGKGSAVSVSITKLQEQTFDNALLTPPPGAEERRFCDVMTAPVILRKPDLSSLGSFTQDVHVRLQITILKDGSVGTVQVIGQNSAEAADRIRRAFRDAKYKPALCGTEPVVADIEAGFAITH